MINLAGQTTNADAQCIKELNDAKIDLAFLEERPKREVKTFIEGKLSFVRSDGRRIEISFYRAWYYWVAKGLVPIDIANKLYATEIGKRDIRVKGDCGRPPPDEHTVYRKMKKEVVLDLDGSEEKEYTEFVLFTILFSLTI